MWRPQVCNDEDCAKATGLQGAKTAQPTAFNWHWWIIGKNLNTGVSLFDFQLTKPPSHWRRIKKLLSLQLSVYSVIDGAAAAVRNAELIPFQPHSKYHKSSICPSKRSTVLMVLHHVGWLIVTRKACDKYAALLVWQHFVEGWKRCFNYLFQQEYWKSRNNRVLNYEYKSWMY